MGLEFVWHLRGSVALDSVATNDAALDAVARLLERQQKPITERGPDYIVFNDPLWRNPVGSNWLAMVIYDRGRFWIDGRTIDRRLRYDLRSLHGIIFCLFGALTGFFFGVSNGDVPQGLKFAGFAFAWLYGMNILLALVRVPQAIRRAFRVK